MKPNEARAVADKIESIGPYFGDGKSPAFKASEVAAALRSLADQVEALQKDHERLEWIIKQTPIAEYSTGAKNFYMGQLPLLHSSIGDMRDAIDRAREAT